MEVFSIIASTEQVLHFFDNFIYNYSKLQLEFKDEDTAYFLNTLTNKHEIFYHFKFIDKDEYKMNYSEKEQAFIQNYFDNITFYIFDLEYKSEDFLWCLLSDFNFFLKKNRFCEKGIKIVYHHTNKGFFEN